MKTCSLLLIIAALLIYITIFHSTDPTPLGHQEHENDGSIWYWLVYSAPLTSVIVSGAALWISIGGRKQAKKTFQRQGVVGLFNAWKGASNLDPNNPSTPDVIHAVNVLGLTAHYWNHDIVDKSILYREYEKPFRIFYDLLKNWNDPLPGLSQSGSDLLTEEIVTVFAEMLEQGPKLPKRTKV